MKIVLSKSQGPYLSRIFGLDPDGGTPIYTPTFIPSVSSTVHGRWESAVELLARGAGKAGMVLVSAFDLAAAHPIPKAIAGFRGIVLDSGGYEARRLRVPWGTKAFSKVLRRTRADIVVGLDAAKDDASVEDQVQSQIRLLSAARKNVLKTLLLHVRISTFDPSSLVKLLLKEATSFDILGLTEKDLGASFPERIEGIVALRREMDEQGLVRPIHIFGADDPLSLVLYSLAGADLFDGLGWATEFIDTSRMCRHDLGHAAMSAAWLAYAKKLGKGIPLDSEKFRAFACEWNVEQFSNLLAEVRRSILHDAGDVIQEILGRSSLQIEEILRRIPNGR